MQAAPGQRKLIAVVQVREGYLDKQTDQFVITSDEHIAFSFLSAATDQGDLNCEVFDIIPEAQMSFDGLIIKIQEV